MATHGRKPNRPSIKSDVKKLPRGLGWSNESRNAGTLKRIEKAIEDEKEVNLTKKIANIIIEKQNGNPGN